MQTFERAFPEPGKKNAKGKAALLDVHRHGDRMLTHFKHTINIACSHDHVLEYDVNKLLMRRKSNFAKA